MDGKATQQSFDFSDDEEEIKITPPLQARLKHYSIPVQAKLPPIYKKKKDQEPSENEVLAAPIVEASPTSAPFGIVLVNIKKAAEERHIHCETRFLDGKTPYVALSYRWGELDEQMVPATKDYKARIVSFQLQDFFKLCQAMQYEPDLQHIDYVWVDAICVDQQNIEKRKATIYRMNDIYIQATAIVAVPDLNAFHMATTSAANAATMATVRRYRHYLYYLLMGTPEAQQTLADMDQKWMDSLGIPPLDVHRRDLALSCKQKRKEQNSDGPSIIQQMMTLMSIPSSQQQDDDPHAKAAHYQQLACRMMVEFQRHEWQTKLDQRKDDIIGCIQFLQRIMEDWSNRTWVISEYHIAKRKTGKLKFWYNQLSCPKLQGHLFFEFDFGKQLPTDRTSKDNYTLFCQQHPYTSQLTYWSHKFKGSMRRRLTKRSVLEMMLQTRASNNNDRFYSIIPLASKYKHHVKDRNSIAAFGISDMLSVRLKLMEWMDVKDRLSLIYSARQPLPSAAPCLPTFATHLKTVKPGLLNLILHHPQCNFDIHDEKGSCVRFIRSPNVGDDGGEKVALDELWLSPYVYYVRCSSKSSMDRQFYKVMGGKANKLWHDLGLDPETDVLDAVSIPLVHGDSQTTIDQETDPIRKGLLSLDIQLVGSWKKNIWLLHTFCSNYKDGKIYPSRMCTMDKKTLPEGFRIY